MSICRILIIFLCSQLTVFNATSQDYTKVSILQDSINNLFQKIKISDNDSDRVTYNQKINQFMQEVLILPESFSFNFDSLKSVGKELSPDKSFRLITWNLPLRDGTYKYFGFIQANNNNTIKLYSLIDKAEDIEKIENSVLGAAKWYGALYYKILLNKVDNKTYYTVFGLRFNDMFTTSKVIEVLYFDQFENAVFGAPIFNVQNKIKLRLVFNYSARVAMSLTYNEKLKMIVFDHLSPSESEYTGQYMYYGPDFSSDGLLFKDKMWQYQSDIIKYTKPQPKEYKGSNKLH